MAATDTVLATYVGPFEAFAADGQLLVPGESKREVPQAEAEASELWRVAPSKTTDKDKG